MVLLGSLLLNELELVTLTIYVPRVSWWSWLFILLTYPCIKQNNVFIGDLIFAFRHNRWWSLSSIPRLNPTCLQLLSYFSFFSCTILLRFSYFKIFTWTSYAQDLFIVFSSILISIVSKLFSGFSLHRSYWRLMSICNVTFYHPLL
jgi:hypothetical protein